MFKSLTFADLDDIPEVSEAQLLSYARQITMGMVKPYTLLAGNMLVKLYIVL